MIKLADGRGQLYQWDTGRQVECDAEQVHFSNHHYGTSIDIDVQDGKATIPNQLLTSATPIKAWAWVKDSNGEYTKEEQIFIVAKRNKPSDYVYTPAEIKTWQDLQNQIGDLNNLTTAHKDNLVNAINDAAESGGGASDFIIKMTVTSDDDINYTVISCDATVEQIDAAVSAEKRVVVIASYGGIIFELPMVQGVEGNTYYFGVFSSGRVIASFARKVGENESNWQFLVTQIEAGAISYSNAALPNISTVGGALDELVPKSHTHDNKSVLDKFAETDGKPTYSGKEIGGAGEFIIKMTVESDADGNFTVASCDATVEQIDAAVTAEKRVVLIASGGYDIVELPMLQGTQGEIYYFGMFQEGQMITSFVQKIDGGTSEWQFLMTQIEAVSVSYSNDALPDVANVGGALDELVPKSHTHANKDTLDKLSDSNGKLQYNGSDVGLKGADGKDGITPTIGANGNWYLDTTDTGKPSRGEKGDKGDPGSDANVTKANVITALGYTPEAVSAQVTTGSNITLADNTEYRLTDVTSLTLTYPTGKFECWMRLTFAASGNITVTLPADTEYLGATPNFKNGETWELSFKDKVLATKKVGADDGGADGITPTIGENGNWFLGTTDTGKPSRGAKGEGLDVSGATVGQIAKISAVDNSGKPTAWEPADLPDITESETVSTPAYTNQIPISTDSSGNIFNGTGYKTGYCLSSSGAEVSDGAHIVSGFIPVTKGDIIRIKDIQFDETLMLALYPASRPDSGNQLGKTIMGIRDGTAYGALTVSNNVITWDTSSIAYWFWNDFAYLRVTVHSPSAVVTVNEEITETTTQKQVLKPNVKVKEENLDFSISKPMLSNKKVVFFGDSIFGMTRDDTSVAAYTSNFVGATTYNVGFGGCRMSVHPSTGYAAFSMWALADAITTGNYTTQDAQVSSGADYFSQQLALLKSIDFNNIDAIIIHYGTNDFTGNVGINNSADDDDTTTLCGALRYAIRKIKTTYPKIRIFISLPIYRMWDNVGAETYTNSGGKKLREFGLAMADVASEFNCPVIDGYKALGVDSYNNAAFSIDGTHLNDYGRQVFGEYIGGCLISAPISLQR